MAYIVERKRISAGTELLMSGVAWSVWGVNALINLILDWVGAGIILSLIFMFAGYCMFAFWFGTKGVSIIKGKALREFVINFLLSLTPVVNVLAFRRTKNGLLEPNIRHMVRRVIEITKEEDANYNQAQLAKNPPAGGPKREPDNIIRPNFRPTPPRAPGEELKKAA